MMNLSAKAKLIFDTNAVEAIFNNNALSVYAHSRLRAYCDPYVPFRTGALSENVRVSSEGVRYMQPYSVYVYYGKRFKFRKDHHPKACAEWDKAMKVAKGDRLAKDIENAVRSNKF